MAREKLVEWAHDSRMFEVLFVQWEKAGYARGLTPSVDRIDPAKGYTLDNVRWLTVADNASLGSRAKNICRKCNAEIDRNYTPTPATKKRASK